MPSRILIFTFVLIGFVVALSLTNFFLSVIPPKFKTKVTPATYNLGYENVSFMTSDGLDLKGWFIPNEKSDAVIIVGHGYPFDKANILQATYFLADEYNLLLFDFRYFGESGGRYSTGGAKESKDILAAVEFLENEKGFAKIGAIGFSMGGAAILMSESKDLKAAVIDSTYANSDMLFEQLYSMFPGVLKLPFVWLTKFYALLFLRINVNEVSPLNSIQEIDAPILLIHGEKDSQIPAKNSQLLYENSNKSRTELWIVPDAGHGMAFALYPDDYEGKVVEFFDKHLK
ncbi:MAG: prolyl oligopeptidase family serine peptidase [Candidatus Aenigmarchaeota archaeon]|nr:prolyl oligopeptidase family serine peptidase [Candidatus Aenigmarchaeota archaeon]